MAIASLRPTAISNATVSLPVVQAPEVKSIISDDRYVPRESLITYVEGSLYTVNYYSQVLAANSELRGHDAGQNATLQQYTKIINFELRVTTPLSGTPEEETSTTLVTGSANVTPPLIPNVGDMFIAPIGDGNEGLFEVKESTRKSMNHDSVYAIEYVLTGRVSGIVDRITDLEKKVVKTVYFYKDNLLQEKSPFLVSEEYNNLRQLKGLFKDIVEHYFKSFFDREYCTLIVPGQIRSVYDKYVTETILKLVNTEDAPEIIKTRVMVMDQDKYLEQPTIWTMLLEKNIDMLPFINNKMGLVTTNMFSANPIFQSIRFTGIQYAMYPIIYDLVGNPDFTIYIPNMIDSYSREQFLHVSYGSLQEVTGQAGDLSELLKNNVLDKISNVPLFNQVTSDSYYVFSEAFYKDSVGCSILESLTLDYLKGRVIDVSKLYSIAKRFRYWGKLEQFYLGVVVMILIKDIINER